MDKRTCVFLWVLRKIINNCLSKGYTILENCDFAVVFLFVVHGFSAGHLNHIIDETTASGFHRLIFYDDTGIEVNPAGLMRRQVGVGRNLHSRHEGTERRTASCSEQHDVAAGRGEGSSCYQIIARSRQQVQSFRLQAFPVGHHARYVTLSAFLCATQCFFFQCRDTSGLVTRRRILAHGLSM